MNQGEPGNFHSTVSEQDSVKDRQILYNGAVWKNIYHGVDGNQFLFSEFFIPATITINNKTFQNIRIKYDIFSDEIITPVSDEEILKLNKEMVDSFNVSFEDKIYRFTNIQNDTLEDFSGYFNVLYSGHTSFYVKYKKSISSFDSSKENGQFIETYKMFLVKGNKFFQINNIKDLLTDLNANKEQIRNFIRKNKLKISRSLPESFVPVVRFYDSISQ